MKEVPALVWGEEIADFADGLDELIEGSGPNPAQMGLQLRKGHLDGVQIRAAGGQEQEPAAMGLEPPGGSIAVVGGQVVEDDHRPWFQFRDQDFFDAGVEGIPVHGTGDHPRRNNTAAGQTRDQGLVAPSPEWGAPLEAFTAQAAPVSAGHPGVGTRLIQKDQPLRLFAHDLLSTAPVMPCFSNSGRVALPGDQAFFTFLYV